jgi:DNA repair protein RecN (Recombination protein N)
MALVELRIGNLAVLRSARLSPGRRFTALTGETGSGKSLCVTALRLALGARLDGPAPVRLDASAASVAAVFDDVPAAVRSRLDSLGIPDDELLTLSRELPLSGRGACRVNGALVSVGTLREVGEDLVEVTAQGESHRLLQAGRQRALVDAAGGAELAALRTAMAATMLRLRETERAVAVARAGRAADAAALERAGELCDDLGGLGLRCGEEVELAAERRRLRHAEELAAASEAVRRACSAEEEGGAADLLAVALAQGRGVEGVDADVDAVLAAARDELERLRDLGARAREVTAALEVDPGRLAAVEERLDRLDRVVRRFGSIEEAVAELEQAQRLVEEAGASGSDVRKLESAAAEAAQEAGQAAARLSAARAAASARLERDVSAQLRRLRLPHARFRVVLGRVADPGGGLEVGGELVACTAEGVDTVEFRVSTARDGVPLPLGSVSGGELSRVALALRSVVALGEDCPTLVLDEVDAGLGGETAARVGEVLAAIGEHRQLLVVTHRPEIAARADEHLVVERHETAAGPEARISEVAGDSRALEVARLMSGRATDAAVARALELLEEGARRPAVEEAARTMAPS